MVLEIQIIAKLVNYQKNGGKNWMDEKSNIKEAKRLPIMFVIDILDGNNIRGYLNFWVLAFGIWRPLTLGRECRELIGTCANRSVNLSTAKIRNDLGKLTL